MKVLKTIVATAVIVFALTTVAMAGVQHFTKAQSGQATGTAPVRYTVALTAQQLAHLMSAQSGSRDTRAQQRTGTHARRAVLTVGAARLGAGALLRPGVPPAGPGADQMGQLLSRERHRVADRRRARRLPTLRLREVLHARHGDGRQREHDHRRGDDGLEYLHGNLPRC